MSEDVLSLPLLNSIVTTFIICKRMIIDNNDNVSGSSVLNLFLPALKKFVYISVDLQQDPYSPASQPTILYPSSRKHTDILIYFLLFVWAHYSLSVIFSNDFVFFLLINVWAAKSVALLQVGTWHQSSLDLYLFTRRMILVS